MILLHRSERMFPFRQDNMDCFDYWWASSVGYNKRSRKRWQVLEAINHIKRKQV